MMSALPSGNESRRRRPLLRVAESNAVRRSVATILPVRSFRKQKRCAEPCRSGLKKLGNIVGRSRTDKVSGYEPAGTSGPGYDQRGSGKRPRPLPSGTPDGGGGEKRESLSLDSADARRPRGPHARLAAFHCPPPILNLIDWHRPECRWRGGLNGFLARHGIAGFGRGERLNQQLPPGCLRGGLFERDAADRCLPHNCHHPRIGQRPCRWRRAQKRAPQSGVCYMCRTSITERQSRSRGGGRTARSIDANRRWSPQY